MILAGIRIALVQVIATVGIGAIVFDGGGVGRFVIDGFSVGVNGRGEVLVGAILMAALVLVAEGLFGLIQSRVVPDQVRAEASGRGDDTAQLGAPA